MFGLSLALIIGVVGFLTYQAATTGDNPPQLVVELGDPQAQPGGYAIPVTLVNSGDQTAEDITVAVTLERDGAEVDQGEFTIAFVPRGSRAEGWVVLRENPQGGALRGQVLGYEQP